LLTSPCLAAKAFLKSFSNRENYKILVQTRI